MKKWIFGILIGLGLVGTGVGLAFIVNKAIPVVSTDTNAAILSDPRGVLPGEDRNSQGEQFQAPSFGLGERMGQPGSGRRGGGRMNPDGTGQQMQNTNSERISLEDAVSKGEDYLKSYNVELKISEVMEFENNFYLVVIETDTGRGAMELLVDPYSGAVTPEMGPNRMWNLKYGRMGRMTASTSDNTLTLEEALAKAQTALTEENPSASVNADGIGFYGYYTFDYSIDGKVAGMLSVNGLDGQVLLHTWHGDFISEKEIQ
jgi:hypothetical protein